MAKLTGMPVGRPPELFSDKEVIVLGQDLISWLALEGKEELMFEPWFYGKHKMFRSNWKSLIQRVGFLPYYEMARKIIASNMIKNKDIAQSYGNRYLGIYDNDVRDHEKAITLEKIDAEVAAKARHAEKTEAPPRDELLQKDEQLMEKDQKIKALEGQLASVLAQTAPIIQSSDSSI